MYTRNLSHYVLKGANHWELLSVGVARRCQVCEHLTIGDRFELTNTKKAYSIMYELNCNSSNVVYLLCCDICVISVLPQREVRGTSRVFQTWFEKR